MNKMYSSLNDVIIRYCLIINVHFNLSHNKEMCEFITVTFVVILPHLIKRLQPIVALLVKTFSAFVETEDQSSFSSNQIIVNCFINSYVENFCKRQPSCAWKPSSPIYPDFTNSPVLCRDFKYTS
jgi:hypothetical protein